MEIEGLAVRGLEGRILDGSGSSVPDAEIKLISTGTGVQRSTKTNQDGPYQVPLLQPGAYQIVVTKDGFRPISRSGVSLQVDQSVRVDFVMEVGSVTEAVQVEASAPLLS